MIHSYQIRRAWILLCFCLLVAHSVTAQSLQRKVFSPAGSVFSHNGQEYGFTIGEPMIGTDLLTIPYLTKGFQQPEPLFLLAPEITLYSARLIEQGIQLVWGSSHAHQASHYLIERAVESGGFVELDRIIPSSGQLSYIDLSPPSNGSSVRFRVIQVLLSGEKIMSNEMEIDLNPGSSPISIYPNPADDWIVIALGTLHSGMLEVEVYNQQGQLVNRVVKVLDDESDFKLETRSLSAGMYWITVPGKSYSQKLLIAR